MRLTIVEDRRKRWFGEEVYGYFIMDDSWKVAWAECKEHAELIKRTIEEWDIAESMVHTTSIGPTFTLKAGSPVGCRLYFPTEYSDSL